MTDNTSLDRATHVTKDMLQEIFDLQRMLNLRIGVDAQNMTEKQRIEWALNYARALSQEIAELTDSVPWKWWAKYQTFDAQNAKVEVIDMLHFVVSLAQVLGMEANDIYRGYTEKHKVNLARQDSGYAEKDAADSKHI